MAKNIGMLIDLDFCVGCYACQLACQNYYDMPPGEAYVKVFNNKPDEIDGHMMAYLTAYPYKLSRCAECLEKEGKAPCQDICIGKAIFVDEVEVLNDMADKMGRKVCIFRDR